MNNTRDTVITFAREALHTLDRSLPELLNYSQFILFYHPRLKELYGASILSALKRFNRPILELVIPEGERAKNLTQAKRCWQTMLARGVDRQAAVIALGGGVICDLAGFVASCYMRGLDSFYLPATLLAMVDAAIGGKTGINLSQGKNAIGTFHFPQSVVIDPSFLMTLPSCELNSGLAEVIKYGMISDLLLVEQLETREKELKNPQSFFLEEVIQRCIKIKNEIVVQDEKDVLDRRTALNYGHTFGHAIEAVTGYQKYLHGEAVAIGMSCAIHLSARLGLCDATLVERQDHLCQRIGLPIQLLSLPPQQLIARMRSDKKATCGKINLILLTRIGKTTKICDVDPLLIKHVLLAKMG